MDCPACRVPMEHSPQRQRSYCPRCRRYALPGDGPAEIEQHERDLAVALALLDAALGERAVQREEDRKITDAMETTMGGTWTKGCTQAGCPGTMWKTYEVDENGRVTGESQWVCSTCGAVD